MKTQYVSNTFKLKSVNCEVILCYNKIYYEKEVNIGQNAVIKFCVWVFRKLANNYVLRLVFYGNSPVSIQGKTLKGDTLHYSVHKIHTERKVEEPSLSNI